MKVTADLDGDKVRLTLPNSSAATLDEAKRIPGAKRSDGPTFLYPLTMTVCRRLRAVYGDRLQIGPKLNRWAKLQIVREEKQIRTGKAHSAELKVLPKMFPETYQAMQDRPYQLSGTRFAADGRTVALLDEVGLGKTIIAIAGVIEAGNWAGPHLVIAKKTALESVWGDQLHRWTNGQAAVFACSFEQREKRQKVIADFMASDAESKWLIINSKMLATKKDLWCNKCKKWERDIEEEDLDHWTMAHKSVNKISMQSYPELQTVAWRAILADEAHEYMSTAIKSAHATTQEAAGLLSLKTTPDVVRFALTGTPDRGRELNLWGIFHWLDPKRYGSKWAWVDHYFQKQENFFGGFEIGDLRPEMRKQFWRDLEIKSLRRTRKEVRPDIAAALPPVVEWVPLEGKHRRQYEQLVEEGRVDLRNGELQTQSFMAEFVRQQQLAWGEWSFDKSGRMVPTAKSPKLARLLDMLEERGINPKGKGDYRVTQRHFKYIVASRFTQLIDFLEDHFRVLGIPTLKITGSVNSGARTRAVRSFQEDESGPRILLLNTMAGGASITLDRHCDTIFALDQTYKVDDQTQLFGRIDNRSVTGPESVPRSMIYIHTKDTIDLKMAENNAAQREMQHELYDARRGVELARIILGEA